MPDADGASPALQERLKVQEMEIQRLRVLPDMLAERDSELSTIRTEIKQLKTQLVGQGGRGGHSLEVRGRESSDLDTA